MYYARKQKAMFCSNVLGRDQAFSRCSRAQEEAGLEKFELSRPGRDKMKIPSSPANKVVRNQLVELSYQAEMKHPKWFEKSRFRD